MGERGPAPKPTQLRILHGDRKDRINTEEPVPAQGEVLPPDGMSERALVYWHRLAPDLIAKGVLTPWDIPAFRVLCNTLVTSEDAWADIDRNGTTLTVVERELSNGTIIYHTTKNPAWQVARESTTMIVTLGGRFGLNPSDRSQLHVKPAEGDKGLERLLS